MLETHRSAFESLLALVRQLQVSPYEQGDICLSIQEKLLSRITVVECRIRGLRKQIKAVKSRRAGTGSQATKERIGRWRERIDDYQRVLHVLRDIGDAIAYIYISKSDIKPMSFKEAPGFISGKAGTKLELDILHEAFKRGRIAILNDLTNCLRYGDLTILQEGSFQIVEAKSGKRSTPRDRRQQGKLEKLAGYLRDDRVEGFYGLDEPVHRQSLQETEVSRCKELNSLIAASYTQGNSVTTVEPGLTYGVLVDSNFDAIDKACTGVKSASVKIVNDLKYKNVGYYPFTLSISDPTHVVDFYCGKFLLIVIVDRDVVRDLYADAGWDATFVDAAEQPFVLHLLNRSTTDEYAHKVDVSCHFWGRLSADFVGLRWLVSQTILPGYASESGPTEETR